jgi:hypothetical protein
MFRFCVITGLQPFPYNYYDTSAVKCRIGYDNNGNRVPVRLSWWMRCIPEVFLKVLRRIGIRARKQETESVLFVDTTEDRVKAFDKRARLVRFRCLRPNFVFGEVLIIGESGREILPTGRAPWKWGVNYEVFDTIEEAVNRSLEVLEAAEKSGQSWPYDGFVAPPTDASGKVNG